MSDVERRFLTTKVELRNPDNPDDKPKMITGRPIVYDQKTTIYDWCGEYEEEIARGAGAKTIKNDDVTALFNHDDNQLLARTEAKTLRLSEEKGGIDCEIDPLLDTHLGNYVYRMVEAGNIRGMSFGFQVVRDEWTWGKDEKPDHRKILEFRLIDVSPVTNPAYKQTSIGVRSARLPESHNTDLQRLARLLLRAERKAELSETDLEFAQNLIQRMSNLLEKKELKEELAASIAPPEAGITAAEKNKAEQEAEYLLKQLDLLS